MVPGSCALPIISPNLMLRVIQLSGVEGTHQQYVIIKVQQKFRSLDICIQLMFNKK